MGKKSGIQQEEPVNGVEENEYIILNRQEEEAEVSERNQHLAAVHAELGKYEYFNWQEIRKSMRLTQAVVKKGQALYLNE